MSKKKNKELIDAATAQIELVLQKLDIKYTRGNIWLSSCCKIHGGDNSHGFGFNIQKGYWKCFTRKCHEQWGSDVISLVAGVLNYNYEDSCAWLLDNLKEGEFKFQKIERKEDAVFPELCLKRLFKTDYYFKKGFSQETVDAFEHGWAERNEMKGRIVFPIRDENGKIRGFSGRWAGNVVERDGKMICVTESGKKVPKWRHTSFNKTNYLYNFYRAKEYAKDELIVVESIGNVMRWWDCGFKNCIACLGSSMAPTQLQSIIATTKTVILAFDNDKAGLTLTKDTAKRLEQFVNVKIIMPPPDIDWAEMTNEEVKQTYDAYISQCK